MHVSKKSIYIAHRRETSNARGGDWTGPLLAVPNVTAHPSTASVPTSYYLMWHYNCLWTLKG